MERYISVCKELGFDTTEGSAGALNDWLRLVDKVQSAGRKAKPEIGIQFGAGGASGAAALEAEGTRDRTWTIHQRFLQAGVPMLMVESEGIPRMSANGALTPWYARVTSWLWSIAMFETAQPSSAGTASSTGQT